jgi:hypothetical protein
MINRLRSVVFSTFEARHRDRKKEWSTAGAAVPLIVVVNVLLDPVDVSLLSAQAVMACTDNGTYLIEEFGHGEFPS